MPIIAQAKKKLRRDKKRAVVTAGVRRGVREAIKEFRAKPTAKSLTTVFTTLDKAAKRNVIHTNKASRLKSRLAKLIAKK